MTMRWRVHGERPIYQSEWVDLTLVDVEIPDGPRFEHHVVRMPAAAAATVVFDPDRGVLLLWRHRFITDTWGWELPAGRIDAGETPEQAAARETLEETGWQPGPMRQLLTYHPVNGLSDHTFHVFIADGATEIGPPSDPTEADRVEWVPIDQLPAIIERGEMPDGFSLTGILHALVTGAIGGT